MLALYKHGDRLLYIYTPLVLVNSVHCILFYQYPYRRDNYGHWYVPGYMHSIIILYTFICSVYTGNFGLGGVTHTDFILSRVRSWGLYTNMCLQAVSEKVWLKWNQNYVHTHSVNYINYVNISCICVYVFNREEWCHNISCLSLSPMC